ncbi:MAG: ABC transporter substrate-binding protein [Amaricoccus sp.]
MDSKPGTSADRTLLRPTRRELLQLGGMGLLAASLPGRLLAQGETPVRGGSLRVAFTGSSASATMDPHRVTLSVDTCRCPMTFDTLIGVDADGKLVNRLAESMEANSDATEWTIRLRDAAFHNGKKLTAADVIFTFRRIMDPANPGFGAAGLAAVDPNGMSAVDDRTVKVKMLHPYSIFPEILSSFYLYGIVPEGFDVNAPVGTGPFVLKSFAPQERSVHVRFDGYWGNVPHLDEVIVIDSFKNENAAFDALRAEEVDAYAAVPTQLAKRVINDAKGPIKALLSAPALWQPFCMRVDIAPFNDPDVRLAMKLLVDREQFVKLAMSGLGETASDLFSPADPDFDHSLVRTRDLDQAKFLLKKAGAEGLTFDLNTSELSSGMIQGAQVFARQAADAGVTVNVKQMPVDLYFQEYFPWPMAQDFWLYSPYMSQVSQSMIPGAPYNETRWDHPEYNALFNDMMKSTDPAKRTETVHAMQRIEFDQGGYIIPGHLQTVDLHSDKVKGLISGKTGYSFANFDFTGAWMA